MKKGTMSSSALLILLLVLVFVVGTGGWKKNEGGGMSAKEEAEERLAETLQLARDLRYSHSGAKADGMRAFEMFEEVARRGGDDSLEAAAALYEMGHFYLHGTDDIPQDLGKASELFKRAYEQGDLDAAHMMAFFYGTGFGGHEVDEAKAVECDVVAALAGHIMASMSLGYRYLHGYGAPKDCERALMWYKEVAIVAIEGETSYAVQPLTDADRLTDETLSATAKDEGGSIRRHWENKAWQGDVAAMYEVGKIYDTGAFGTTPDLIKAAEAYKEAAERGYPAAMSDLGLMYAQGQGVPQDYDQAVDLLTKASDLGDSVAQNALAYMYKMGVALDVDHYEARALFQAAAEAGQGEALYHLGEYALEDKKYALAVKYFRRAGAAGYLLGRFREGQVLEAGMDEWETPRSCVGAVAAYKDVAEGGYWLDNLRAAKEELQKEGRAESAVVTMALLAEEGFAIAQANTAFLLERRLGYKHENGNKLARRWYERAVEQGDEAVLFDLAHLMLKEKTGTGLSRAISLLEASAEAGDLRAIRRLAGMYEHGQEGVPQDRQRAEHMYRTLISSTGLSTGGGGVVDYLSVQTVLHLRLLRLMATNGLKSMWQGGGKEAAAGGQGGGGGMEVVEGRFEGDVYWLVEEGIGNEGRWCLGAKGSMELCSAGAMWAVSGKGKDKAIVRFGQAEEQGTRCLVVGDGGRVQVADCAARGVKKWVVDSKGRIRHDRGRGCLVRRGVEVVVAPCKAALPTASSYPLTLVRRQVGSFLLKSRRDGQCFFGGSFGSCHDGDAAAKWTAALEGGESNNTPGGFSLYKARVGYKDGRRMCLRRRRKTKDVSSSSSSPSSPPHAVPQKSSRKVDEEEEEVVLGLCTGKSAAGWSVSGGRIEAAAEGGRWYCVARDREGGAKLVGQDFNCELVDIVGISDDQHQQQESTK